MVRSPAVAVALAALLVVTLLAAPSAGQAAPAAGDRGQAAVAAQETDNTVTRVAVRADGDARWTVRYRTRLSTEADVEEYRVFQRRFRENTSQYLDPFAERIRGVVAGAANETGREMAARNVSARTDVQEVPRRWGVVSFSFTWTNFARVEGDALVVGDVFEGGFFLATNDSLVVAAPEGYGVAAANPPPADAGDREVTWTGREDFGDRRPRVRMVPSSTTTRSATGTPGRADGGVPSPSLLAAVAVVVLAALGVGLAARRRGWVAGAGDGDAGETAPVLTDAERVERLVASAGGRMKQGDVADELGWSASKTSRVVAALVEEGRVEKLRIGRENVLDLVEAD